MDHVSGKIYYLSPDNTKTQWEFPKKVKTGEVTTRENTLGELRKSRNRKSRKNLSRNKRKSRKHRRH
jgi:hypothetical protein